jgi:Ca2+-transporting ATPase
MTGRTFSAHQTSAASDELAPNVTEGTAMHVSDDMGRLCPLPHARSPAEVLRSLGADRQCGLTAESVRERQTLYGLNALQKAPPAPWWKRWLDQFRGLVVWILIAAAVIAASLGERSDTIVILAIVFLNALLGFIQEGKASRALEALQDFAPPQARVMRDGVKQILQAREIVPGDILELEAGDVVPADGRLLDSYALLVQEAALTGESLPVDKAVIVLAESTALADRRNMVFHGTHVAAGKATAVVTATGMSTELGKIAGMLERIPRNPTPLERRLEELGRTLIVVCLTLVVIVFLLQVIRGGELVEVFFVSVSLAVAAVPEGLPAVVTISLALGLQRLARRKALVRQLPSVETWGAVTVICTDKTGTLTRNEMTVERAFAGSVEWSLADSSYRPVGTGEGAECIARNALASASDTGFDDLRWLLTIGMHCNNAAVVSRDGTGPGQTTAPHPVSVAGRKIVGDPTEAALLIAAMTAGLPDRSANEKPIAEIPFDPDRRMMSVVVPVDGRLFLFTKGAPESVLASCTQTRCRGRVEAIANDRKEELTSLNAAWAGDALRVLALAYREVRDASDTDERELVLAGLVGMLDPPRSEVKEAVGRCHAAGVRAVMITGDHPQTAEAIARQLGIDLATGRALTGAALDAMSDEQFNEAVEKVNVYARVSAGHKLRIVRALKQRGEVAAMTGDGVNDAPAVQLADIGIAMGVTGTDVTKAAADLVLVDDNFASIVNAIEEGRGIFDNIQKIVHYLLAGNAGEVLFMFLASLIGWPLPLEAIQILWINLVSDGLPALALAAEPTERDVMQRPPRPASEGVLTLRSGVTIVVHGLLIAATTAGAFWFAWRAGSDPQVARTTAFYVLAFSQLFYSFACRSRRSTFFELRPWSNPILFAAIAASAALQATIVFVPALRDLFRVSGPQTISWLMVLAASLIPVTVVELSKIATSLYQRLFEENVHGQPTD